MEPPYESGEFAVVFDKITSREAEADHQEVSVHLSIPCQRVSPLGPSNRGNRHCEWVVRDLDLAQYRQRSEYARTAELRVNDRMTRLCASECDMTHFAGTNRIYSTASFHLTTPQHYIVPSQSRHSYNPVGRPFCS